MKKYFLLVVLALLVVACKKEAIQKPDNLIPQDKMKKIIYDITLLQAIRGVNQAALDSNRVDAVTYIYKKYKVDSLQFAKSDQYYATKDIKEYEKMYQDISTSIVNAKVKADSLAKKEEDTTKKLILDKGSIDKNAKPVNK